MTDLEAFKKQKDQLLAEAVVTSITDPTVDVDSTKLAETLSSLPTETRTIIREGVDFQTLNGGMSPGMEGKIGEELEKELHQPDAQLAKVA